MSDYSSNFPQQRPKLNLVFNSGSDKLDSRLSYSRSSGGTYLSNEKSLNSENLISQSADLGSWSQGSSPYTTITSNATAAPDGTTTAAQIEGLTGSGKKAIYHPISAGAGSYTGIFYVKPNGHEYVQIMFGSVATIYQNFHLSGSGTLGNGTNDAASIDKMGDWYRITITSDAISSASNFYVVMVDSNTAARYEDSVSTSSIFAWGANFSSTNQKVFNSTTSQIHREFAPTLKTASADSPRFEFASDGQSVGLLIESQATSLITYSEDFSNSFWDKTRLSVDSNVATAPDGALTASALRVDGTAASTHRMRFTYATGGATAQTFSIFAKAGSKSWLALKFDSSGGAFDASIAYFNLASGTTGTVDSGVTATINDCGNGWYRCSITRTALASATGQIELYVGEADNDVTIDGNSYDHILAWGAMVEANTSAPSSYIKSNSGSSTTKSADSCSVADFGFTGGPVSITTEVTAAASADGTQRIFTLFENSDLVSTYFSGGGDIKTFVDVGGSTQVDASILANAVSGTDYKVGISFDTNDYRGAYNGTLGAADTSCTLPTFSQPTLQIAAQSGGTNPFSGHIKRLSLYNVALSDVELQSLTTS